MLVSHPAPHPLNVVFISCSELTAHLGFLEGNVDPISGGEDGDRRNEHWPTPPKLFLAAEAAGPGA